MATRRWKKFDDMFSPFDRILACDGQIDGRMDGRTACDSIVRAIAICAEKNCRPPINNHLDCMYVAMRHRRSTNRMTAQTVARTEIQADGRLHSREYHQLPLCRPIRSRNIYSSHTVLNIARIIGLIPLRHDTAIDYFIAQLAKPGNPTSVSGKTIWTSH